MSTQNLATVFPIWSCFLFGCYGKCSPRFLRSHVCMHEGIHDLLCFRSRCDQYYHGKIICFLQDQQSTIHLFLFVNANKITQVPEVHCGLCLSYFIKNIKVIHYYQSLYFYGIHIFGGLSTRVIKLSSESVITFLSWILPLLAKRRY